MTSRRATGRRSDLRLDVLERLRSHAPLLTQLEALDGVDDGAALIMPLSPLRSATQDDDAPPALVGVSVVTGDSRRENRQERTNLLVEGRLTVTEAVLDSQGLYWFDVTTDEIEAVLTTHTEGWSARGITGGTPEPRWDEATNRHRAILNAEYQHWG